MATTGVTDIAAVTMDLIAKIVQNELINEGVLANTITNYSFLAEEGLDTVSIPRLGSFSVNDKVEDTDDTEQALTFATDKILLNKHKIISALVEDIAKIQSRPDLKAEYIKRMSTALVDQVDQDLATVVKQASVANTFQFTGGAGDEITQADILKARRLLDKGKVRRKGRVLVVSSVQEEVMLKIDGFVDASKYGSSGPVQNGEFGRIYGMPVLMSLSFGDNEAAMYHPEHVGWAIQRNANFEEQRAPLKKKADEMSVDMIYGTKVLDLGVRGVFMDDTP